MYLLMILYDLWETMLILDTLNTMANYTDNGQSHAVTMVPWFPHQADRSTKSTDPRDALIW